MSRYEVPKKDIWYQYCIREGDVDEDVSIGLDHDG